MRSGRAGTAPSTDNVVLKATNFPDGSTSVQAAGNMWNDTNGGGFPMFVSSTPSGTFNTITVNYSSTESWCYCLAADCTHSNDSALGYAATGRFFP